MQYKYTIKQFNSYKKYCKHYLALFGITEWDVDYKHHKIDAQSRVSYNNSARIACFQLTTKGTIDFCYNDDMQKLALHEVLHLLLADLAMGKESVEEIAIEHTVIQRLINAMSKVEIKNIRT